MVTSTACSDTYQDVEKMIYRLCWGAVSRFGGEFDDYLSEANEAYMKAFYDFDRRRGAFTTCVWVYVVNGIRKFLQDESRRLDRWKTNTVSNDVAEDEESYWVIPGKEPAELERLVLELGDDARTVVMLTVNAPKEIYGLLRGKPEKSQRLIWWFLKELGWSMGRAIDSFDEIREVLEDA